MTDATKNPHYPLRIAVMIVLALSVLAILVYSFFGGGFIDRLLVLTGLREEERVVTTYLFTGEHFAMAGDKLAVASSVGAQLIEESGMPLAVESFAMDVPVVSASKSISVFYDLGGTAMCLMSAAGESILCPSDYPIRFADASEEGYVTVVTDYPGYRGRVQVFTPSYLPVFTIDCGTSGYPICARVSPGGILVINSVSSTGSALHFYALDSDKELATVSFGQSLIREMDFLQDGTLAVLTVESLTLLSEKGREITQIELTDRVLSDYCLTGRNAVVLLHDDFTGSEGVLRSYTAKGELLGELPVDWDVYSLSALDKQILVLYPTELTLYHENFGNDISYQGVANSTLCLLPAENEALLLGRSGAELIRFSD